MYLISSTRWNRLGSSGLGNGDDLWIARSIAAATRETGAVAANIQAVDGSTRDTTTAALSMVDASGELDRVAGRLRDEATAFVARIRA